MRENKYQDWKSKRKKRSFRFVIASMVLLSIVLVPSQSVSASDSKITYDGNQKKLFFENVKGTDLFGGMKGVLPGDVRKQHLSLKAKSVNRETSFYLRAECDEQTESILKDVTMDLKVDGKTILKDGLVFEQIKLGTVGKKEELPLELSMNFPVTLGNEVMGQELHVKWIVSVQEDGKEILQETIPDHIKTGDQEKPFLYLALMGCSLICVLSFAVIIWLRKRRNS